MTRFSGFTGACIDGPPSPLSPWLPGLCTVPDHPCLGGETSGGRQKTHQKLRAYEGDRLVIETRISTGKWDKSTPNGQFQAGDKSRRHYSELFQSAPMPYSVQVNGNVFIHGFTSVPSHPASHGGMRLLPDGDNPAKRFYEWVDPGTPAEISGQRERR